MRDVEFSWCWNIPHERKLGWDRVYYDGEHAALHLWWVTLGWHWFK